MSLFSLDGWRSRQEKKLVVKDTNVDDDEKEQNMGSFKEKQLLQHLADIEHEYKEKVWALESSLDHATTENDAYESQIAALRQHNEYLREASTEWRTKYNDTKICLLNAKDEIITLKSELSNLRRFYDADVEKIQNQEQILTAVPVSEEDNETARKLQQRIDENKQIKKENSEYLKQLKAMNQQQKECELKYNALNGIHMSLQHDFEETKAQNSDLEAILNEYALTVKCLDHANADLKQTVCCVYVYTRMYTAYNCIQLNERADSRDSLELDSAAVPVSYGPEISKSNRLLLRVNSFSYAKSLTASPSVSNCNFTGSFYQYLPSPTPLKLEFEDDTIAFDKVDNQQHVDKYHELYKAVNENLFDIEECVQKIYKLKRGNGGNFDRARRTSFKLMELSKERKSVDDEDEDEIEKEVEVETISKVLDKNEEEEQLLTIDDIVEKVKTCVFELNQQKIVLMNEERKRFDSLYSTFTAYQKQTAMRIKRLTKDTYRLKYKKYNGCREIVLEALGNAGTYTKDAIIHRLTR